MNRRSAQDAIRLVIVILYFLFVSPGFLFAPSRGLDGVDLVMYIVTVVLFLVFLGLEILEFIRWSYWYSRPVIPRWLFGLRTVLMAIPVILLPVLSRTLGPVSSRYMQFSLFSHLFMLLSLFPFYAYFALPRPVGFGILTVCIAAPLVQQLVISGGKPWDSTSVGFLTYRILTVIFFYGLAWLLDAEKKRSEENRRLLRRLRASDSRLREYADRVAGTVALEERTRLARDIHDSLGHALTAIKIQLSKAVAYHDVDLDESFAAVNAARETADDAMKDIRESLGRLNGEAAAITLAEGLPRLVNRLDDSGVEVQYRYQGSEEGYNYSVLMGLYRFVQEGVTNILKHASASRASLIVEFGPAEATAELNDNGTGFNPAEPESDPVTDHYGLRGLRRRLELVRGTMEVVSKPGEGTRLFARVPKDPVALIGNGDD